MPQPVVCIELGRTDPITLRFQLRSTPLAQRWLSKWHASQCHNIDDPSRFYGFNDTAQEIDRAQLDIQRCIDVINSHQPIIQRPFVSVFDQDTLNYLHNIFERYHGLLDQQNHDYWLQAPVAVRQALAQLNVAVHRCESAARGRAPSLVCTWYGLAKTDHLPLEEMSQYGELLPAFGAMCFCYVEIGKTLEDLTRDNDNYIADQAFKPFDFYSSDFSIRFCQPDPAAMDQKLSSMRAYHAQHINWFQQRGLGDFHDPRLLPLKFPFADLIPDVDPAQLIDLIRPRQFVNRIYLQ